MSRFGWIILSACSRISEALLARQKRPIASTSDTLVHDNPDNTEIQEEFRFTSC